MLAAVHLSHLSPPSKTFQPGFLPVGHSISKAAPTAHIPPNWRNFYTIGCGLNIAYPESGGCGRFVTLRRFVIGQPSAPADARRPHNSHNCASGPHGGRLQPVAGVRGGTGTSVAHAPRDYSVDRQMCENQSAKLMDTPPAPIMKCAAAGPPGGRRTSKAEFSCYLKIEWR